MKRINHSFTDAQIEDLANELDPLPVNRRDFMKLMGGGLFVLFNAGKSADAQSQRQLGPTDDFNAFVRIHENGRVSCFTGKIEMGQGIVTSLAQMCAEELDVQTEMVDMVMGDTDLCPWDMGTWGSMTTPYFGPALRKASATARATLVQMAANHFKTTPDKLETADGTVFFKGNPGKKVTYAELTKGKKIAKLLDKTPPLKKHAKHFTAGKPTLRKDGRDKVTGKAHYSADIRLPGMLYGKLLRPPAHGATVKSVDVSKAEKIEGVKIIQGDGIVAALHKFPDVAEKARDLIKAEYNLPDPKKNEVNNATIFKHLRNAHSGEQVVKQAGDIKAGQAKAVKTVEGSYYNHYVAHAPLEPHAAIAKVEGNKATVWASTQAPFRTKSNVARALGFKSDDVRVIPPPLGGGFGGKSWDFQAVEAAKLAKLAGKPVQVAWSRKEEFFYDAFRPAAIVDTKSGVTGSGEIAFWDNYIFFAGSRGSEPVYEIPNLLVKSRGGWNSRNGEVPTIFM
jgi:isoquinoline 1-oxidoreductase